MVVGAFIGAVLYDTHGASGGWKLRVNTLSSPAFAVGIMLVVAAYLAATTAGAVPRAVDLGQKVLLAVPILAAVVAFTLLLALLVDLSNLGDEFGLAVAGGFSDLGSLVLVAAAAAGAVMARPAKS